MSTRETIEEHARRGEKIQAIKIYRDLTGASLKESKEAVEAFMASRRWSPASQAALGGKAAAAAPAPVTRPALDLSQVVELIRVRQKIAAIKELRMLTGLGLKEAKEAVEAFASRGVWPASVAPASTPAPAPSSAPAPLNLATAEAFARAGRKIDAIKELRRLVNLGLKDAKDAVEAFIAAGAWPASLRGAAPALPAPVALAAPPAPTPPRPATKTATTKAATTKTSPAASPTPPAPSPPSAPSPAQAARPTRKQSLDPDAAEAAAGLEKRLGGGSIDQIHACERDFARGYLATRGERAYFLVKRFGEWDIACEYAKSEGVTAEVHSSLSRVELRLRKTFLFDAITGLDEATARAIARLLDDRAKV